MPLHEIQVASTVVNDRFGRLAEFENRFHTELRLEGCDFGFFAFDARDDVERSVRVMSITCQCERDRRIVFGPITRIYARRFALTFKWIRLEPRPQR